MSLKSRVPILAAFATLACSGFTADPLQMQVVPALEGFTPSVGTMPVAVNLRNDGPNARGTLRVIGTDGYQMDYPVELPRGSQKRLITYPSVSYGGLRYLLDTDQGRVLKNYEPSTYGSQQGGSTVLLISDTSGELSFLRGRENAAPQQDPYGRPNQSMVQDAYTSPMLAPNRPVGYVNISAVVLGGGAERLSDDQVHALKMYVLAGGTLTFLGGASSPILGDARWQELLPAHDFHVDTLQDSPTLERLGNDTPPPVSVMSGAPIPGAIVRRDGKTLISAERGYGIGKVVYLSFNPLEAPLNKWEGRQRAMTMALRTADAMQRSAFLSQFATSYSGWQSAPYSTATMAATPAGMPPGGAVGFRAATAAQDPFSTQLPPAGKVFTLLGAYFLVVVPLNFIVLKKLRRGEWAWFSAPLISLGFAGAFFSSAQDLYSAKMSSASQGVILAQQGMDEGLFVGMSQLFVPRSGSYDLKMQGVDSLGVVNVQQGYGYGRREEHEADFDPIDVGEIVVPHMQANNLAFREISFRQRLPVGQWFSIETKREGEDIVRCTVRNRSSYVLENAGVMVGDTQSDFGTLEPGATKEVEVHVADPVPTQQGGTWSLPQILNRYRGIALIGTVRGFRPGPQLGEQVDSRTSVRLTMIAKEALGPK